MKEKWPILYFSEFVFIKLSYPKYSLLDSGTQSLIRKKCFNLLLGLWIFLSKFFFIKQNTATYGGTPFPHLFLKHSSAFLPSHILWVYCSLSNNHFIAPWLHLHSSSVKSLPPCSPGVSFPLTDSFPQYQDHWFSKPCGQLYHNWWVTSHTL